jgi:signal transduction histidine kinase
MTRQQINDYATATIALIIMAVIFWYVSTTETSTALKKLEKAQQTTDTQTKEVKQIETIYHTTIKQNDTIIRQKVQEAYNSVPDDTDALIQLANSIISSSNKDKRYDSTDEPNRPKDLDNRNTGQ